MRPSIALLPPTSLPSSPPTFGRNSRHTCARLAHFDLPFPFWMDVPIPVFHSFFWSAAISCGDAIETRQRQDLVSPRLPAVKRYLLFHKVVHAFLQMTCSACYSSPSPFPDEFWDVSPAQLLASFHTSVNDRSTSKDVCKVIQHVGLHLFRRYWKMVTFESIMTALRLLFSETKASDSSFWKKTSVVCTPYSDKNVIKFPHTQSAEHHRNLGITRWPN